MNGLQWGMVKVKWHWTYFNILRILHWKPRVVTMSHSSSLVVQQAVNLQCHQRWQSCHHNDSIFGVCHLICIWYISSSMHTAFFSLFFLSYYVKTSICINISVCISQIIVFPTASIEPDIPISIFPVIIFTWHPSMTAILIKIGCLGQGGNIWPCRMPWLMMDRSSICHYLSSLNP